MAPEPKTGRTGHPNDKIAPLDLVASPDDPERFTTRTGGVWGGRFAPALSPRSPRAHGAVDIVDRYRVSLRYTGIGGPIETDFRTVRVFEGAVDGEAHLNEIAERKLAEFLRNQPAPRTVIVARTQFVEMEVDAYDDGDARHVAVARAREADAALERDGIDHAIHTDILDWTTSSYDTAYNDPRTAATDPWTVALALARETAESGRASS